MHDDIYNLDLYQFDLDPDLIASYPIKNRDECRLLVLNRRTGSITDALFHELPQYLQPDDLIILNNSKVNKARVFGQKNETGARIECLLIRCTYQNVWEALCKPLKRLRIGDSIYFTESIHAEVVGKTDHVLLDFGTTNVNEFMELHGDIPLPVYMNRKSDHSDEQDYQTVYAKKNGSVAAPTAGLHFTENVFTALQSHQINHCSVTLHVGPGTFKPVKHNDIREHKMHQEYFELDQTTKQNITDAKRRIAVGTTSCRVLESMDNYDHATDIFIYPGYVFKRTDGLITNFHLPGSTLIMLVAAFCGIELMKEAYTHAIEKKYRFYSYGDAMLII